MSLQGDEMNLYMFFYVVSVACQLSGSLLLLLKFSFVNVKNGIVANKKKETHARGENLIIGNTQPTSTEYKENVCLNRIAFALLAIGYLLSVFGKIDDSQRCVALMCIIILSAGITLVSFFASTKKGNDKAD